MVTGAVAKQPEISRTLGSAARANLHQATSLPPNVMDTTIAFVPMATVPALFDVPQDCGVEESVTCYSLLEAAGSFFEGLWATFWSWFNSESDDDDDERDMSIT